MKASIFIILCLIIISCRNTEKEKYSEIPRKLEYDSNYCEYYSYQFDSTKNIEDVIDDFYKNSPQKDSLQLNLCIGAYYHKKKEYKLALTYFFKGYLIDSLDPKINFNISLSLGKLKMYSEALKHVNIALQTNCKSYEHLGQKCFLLNKLGRYKEAIEVALQAKDINPDDKKVYISLILYFDKLEYKDSIIKYFEIMDKLFDDSLSDCLMDIKEKYKN
ncbi:MAG: hypothetical protein A2W91_04260 [Bacteroidetes bacterium GWF2_38_335]|nr:MAG: hypothetical protein A2W91_04260 [Bacteroidetes bacterium GWF2_38_335]HBS88749.1 hypothetical protein [Bacteroidales bacterium]